MLSHQLSDYELGEVLGVGTVGTIYLAREKTSGQLVALKKLHPRVCQNTLIRARFRREMTILERLRHPNIVSYLGGGRGDQQTLFYVMEVVHGGTVADLINFSGPIDWRAVVEITRQTCSALQCAHNHGIVHRDLKPSNLFLTPEGEIKLGDFGIARDLTAGDLTAGGVTVGTHAYMAPEQITGDRSVDGKVDLYALGCCMFEMLTARKVFLGEDYVKLFDQHLKAKPPSPRDFVECPESLENVIFQLLAKSAHERPFNARTVQGEMLDIAREYLGDVGEEDSRDSPIFEPGRQELTEGLRRRMAPPTTEVSGRKLAMAIGVIAAVVLVLSLLSKLAKS